MAEWVIEPTEQYERDFKYYEKKLPYELSAVSNNLGRYLIELNVCGNPLQVRAGYIHNEPEGIRAIDQKGGGKKNKLQQTRLYIFPDCSANKLYLLAIGGKTNQGEDINKCRDIVRRIKRGE